MSFLVLISWISVLKNTAYAAYKTNYNDLQATISSVVFDQKQCSRSFALLAYTG